MAKLNKVFLIGNLTRDPELRYVPSGSAVTNFTVATNRTYTLQSGEKKEEVCYVRIVVWGRLAETCGEYLSKGSPVFVEGRLQSRSWETPQGEKRSTLEVIAQNVQFLGRGKGVETALTSETANEGEAPDIPFAADTTGKKKSGEVESNSDEELPF
ncbi:MAG: hypothetical protein AMJ78_02155 [Omnitrophica WOR_2 bacterium SM23_29]|nr:MAG: hypothetical protein AMJ78_02155 [Omnitrophica WOR_2 bacterium SM23_29]